MDQTLFYWLNRIIVGDTLFGISIWLVCLLSGWLASLANWPKWVRWLYFITLSFFAMALAHYLIDILQIWWLGNRHCVVE